MKIKDKQDDEIYTTLKDFALLLYKEGHLIVWCDMECLAKSCSSGDYFIIDECGHVVELDPDRFEVLEE